MKKLISAVLVLLSLYPLRLYSTADLTAEVLENRAGTLVIECCVGVVLDDEGNGQILNAEPPFNYISYRSVSPHPAPGTKIISYFVYNPQNNIIDDITLRFDFPQQ